MTGQYRVGGEWSRYNVEKMEIMGRIIQSTLEMTTKQKNEILPETKE